MAADDDDARMHFSPFVGCDDEMYDDDEFRATASAPSHRRGMGPPSWSSASSRGSFSGSGGFGSGGSSGGEEMEPPALCCPVLQTMFRDPVFVPDSGNTYDRQVRHAPRPLPAPPFSAAQRARVTPAGPGHVLARQPARGGAAAGPAQQHGAVVDASLHQLVVRPCSCPAPAPPAALKHVSSSPHQGVASLTGMTYSLTCMTHARGCCRDKRREVNAWLQDRPDYVPKGWVRRARCRTRARACALRLSQRPSLLHACVLLTARALPACFSALHACMHACIQRTHCPMYVRMYAHACALARAHTHKSLARRHGAGGHARTHARTHTHTHTHTC